MANSTSASMASVSPANEPSRDLLQPPGHRRLAVPGQPVPSKKPELADDAHHVRRMTLDERRVEDTGQDREVPFGAGWAVEKDEIVLRSHQPARQAVGQAAKRLPGTLADRHSGDGEPGRLVPVGGLRGRPQDGAATGDATFEDD